MSIKAEILIILGAAAAPLTARQVLDACELKTTQPTVWTTMSALKAQKLIEPAGKSEPAEGQISATTYRLTDSGRALLTDDGKGIKTSRGGVPRKPRKAKRRAKGAHRKGCASRKAQQGSAQSASQECSFAPPRDGSSRGHSHED